jgi:hypothetical protein
MKTQTAAGKSCAWNPWKIKRKTLYGYHKVLPGKRDDFLKLAKAWKKIVADDMGKATVAVFNCGCGAG